MSVGVSVELSPDLINRLRGKELEQKITMVWKRFYEMVSFPYPKTPQFPKGDASHLLPYFEKYAVVNKFTYETDPCQNVCISVDASFGHEKDREIIVQAHHDGVFVGKPDPRENGIHPVVVEEDGDSWVKGNGTNLTADNRLGCAVALTVVEDLVKSGKPHGPTKILITAGEDSGLIGANYLGQTKSKFLNGNQTLINVDSSDGADYLTIGCASGSVDDIKIPVKYETIGDKKPVKFSFSGFPGGHSGLDIGKDRPSSIIFFAELFSQLKKQFPDIGLVTIEAGEAFNVIPFGANFVLSINRKREDEIQKFIASFVTKMKQKIPPDATDEYVKSRKNIDILAEPLSEDDIQTSVQFDEKTTDVFIKTLLELPQGVEKKEDEIIFSSNNIGTIRVEKDEIIIGTMARGKEAQYRDRVLDIITEVVAAYGLTINNQLSFHHWAPQPERPLVKLAKFIGETTLGKEIKTRVSGGGLEPGIFERDFPGLEAISISVAKIDNEHVPGERAKIDSLPDGYKLLEALLTGIPTAYST